VTTNTKFAITRKLVQFIFLDTNSASFEHKNVY